MALQKYRILYPDCLFRAVIRCKNIAPPEDKWAEGAICQSENGELFIINRRVGEGVYGFAGYDPETLGLDSCFLDGNKADIFEGDIIRITSFVPPAAADDEDEQEDDENELSGFSGFVAETFGAADEDEQPQERDVFADIPDGAQELSTVSGVVYMNGGAFYLQYYDEGTGCLNALPLALYFMWDNLPAPGIAVKLLGNLYDNEDLYAQVLHLAVKKEPKKKSKAGIKEEKTPEGSV